MTEKDERSDGGDAARAIFRSALFVPIRAEIDRADERTRTVLRLYMHGYTLTEIAVLLGLTLGRISQIMKAFIVHTQRTLGAPC